MDAADLVGINGADGNRFDATSVATGQNEHLRFVFKAIGATKQFGNQLPMNHAKPALSVGNILSTKPANLSAHVTVDEPANPRHVRDVVHSIAKNQLRFWRRAYGR